MTSLKPHGISRAEWVRRFKETVIRLAGLKGNSNADSIVEAELETWPEQDENPVPGFNPDWESEAPESAALENLSYWTA